MPEQWHRKLSATRSPVRIERSEPRDPAELGAGSIGSPSRTFHSTSTCVVELAERLGRRARCPRARPRRARRTAPTAVWSSSMHAIDVMSPSNAEVLGERGRDDRAARRTRAGRSRSCVAAPTANAGSATNAGPASPRKTNRPSERVGGVGIVGAGVRAARLLAGERGGDDRARHAQQVDHFVASRSRGPGGRRRARARSASVSAAMLQAVRRRARRRSRPTSCAAPRRAARRAAVTCSFAQHDGIGSGPRRRPRAIEHAGHRAGRLRRRPCPRRSPRRPAGRTRGRRATSSTRAGSRRARRCTRSRRTPRGAASVVAPSRSVTTPPER